MTKVKENTDFKMNRIAICFSFFGRLSGLVVGKILITEEGGYFEESS